MRKGTAHDPKPPPHLSNRAGGGLHYGTGPARLSMELAFLDDFTSEEAAGWLQKCTGAFCVFRFSQNSADDISSFSQTAVQNIQAKQLKRNVPSQAPDLSLTELLSILRPDLRKRDLRAENSAMYDKKPLMMTIGQSLTVVIYCKGFYTMTVWLLYPSSCFWNSETFCSKCEKISVCLHSSL